MAARATVLVLASAPPTAARVEDVAGRLRAVGARVLLAAPRVPDDVTSFVDGIHELGPAAAGHGPAFRRSLRGVGKEARLLLLTQADVWVRAQAGAVDVVTALDEDARAAARQLAEGAPGLRFRPRPKGAVEVVQGGITPRTPLLTPVAAGAPALLDDAEVRARAATLGPRRRADLLGEAVSRALAEGRPTALARDAYAAELEVADVHLAAGDVAEAAWSFGEALRTAFHPGLHFDALTSPLADDPRGFTAPLWGSAVARAMRGGSTGPDRPRRASAPVHARTPTAEADGAATPERGRPVRLLIAMRGTEMFAGLIRRHFEAHPGYDVRYVAFPELPGLMRYVDNPAAWADQVLSGAGDLRERAEALLRPHLDWADIAFVDWCSQLAGLLTQVDPGDTRVIVRLHSYEPFTRWPQLVDFSRVDDIVFVSEHLQRLSVASIPGLTEAATRRHVVPNAVDLRPFARAKSSDARFTVALVGASKVVKDPRWTIEVLRLLRRHDERYRLHLIGGRFQDTSAAVHPYAEALAADLAELEPLGAVERIHFTEDVPAALQRVGVILSSSVRESFHLGLAEGAASGAVPVVRDWPFFPGAPAELFPAEWVVQTPEQAAARILALTSDEQTWRAAGQAASAEVLARWDWSVVSAAYERLFAGRT